MSAFTKHPLGALSGKGQLAPPDLLFSTEGKGGAFKRQLEAR